MPLKIYRNTNEHFGDTEAIYQAESIDALVTEMRPQIEVWAREESERANDAAWNCEGDEISDEAFSDIVARISNEFRSSLVEINASPITYTRTNTP